AAHSRNAARMGRDTGREDGELDRIARSGRVIEGHLADDFRVVAGAFELGRARLDEVFTGRHGDGLGNVAELELELDVDDLVGFYDDVFAGELLEPGELGRNAVGPEREVREAEGADRRRFLRSGFAGVDVAESDGDARDERPRL